jgi:uncharacterized membrane protein
MNWKLFQRYPALLPILILSGLSVFLFFCRVFATGSFRFSFLNWNLFLAWLPLLWAWLLINGLKVRRWQGWQLLSLTVLWLAFLPNSFYLVTDFIHLNPYLGVSLVFDSIMFMSFALTGLLLGVVSVFLVHRELIKRLPKKQVWLLLAVTFLLCSYAIYLGRYLGWNSWDLITDPAGILFDVFERLLNPSDHPGMFTTTALFFAFISCVYASFYGTLRALKLQK